MRYDDDGIEQITERVRVPQRDVTAPSQLLEETPSVEAVQSSGVLTIWTDSVEAIQSSGVSAIGTDSVEAVQSSGVLAIGTDSVEAVQSSGVSAIGTDSVEAVQSSGVSAICVVVKVETTKKSIVHYVAQVMGFDNSSKEHLVQPNFNKILISICLLS